jgi:hypothetical protein
MTLRELGWPTFLVLCATLALVILWVVSGGLLEAALSGWMVAVAGIGCLVLALVQTRRWWLLVFLPILAIPLIFVGMLLYECGRGNCL